MQGAHTTNDEKNFIDGISNFSTEGLKMGHVKTLTNYIAALKKRTDWDGMDAKVVMTYAVEKLKNLVAMEAVSDVLKAVEDA